MHSYTFLFNEERCAIYLWIFPKHFSNLSSQMEIHKTDWTLIYLIRCKKWFQQMFSCDEWTHFSRHVSNSNSSKHISDCFRKSRTKLRLCQRIPLFRIHGRSYKFDYLLFNNIWIFRSWCKFNILYYWKTMFFFL